MTVQHSNPVRSIFDADAAVTGAVDRGAVFLDEGGKPRAEAIVVPARFAGGPFVADTTTNGAAGTSHRVVNLEVPGLGDIDLFPHEAVDLARALLSRVRFAQEFSGSGDAA